MRRRFVLVIVSVVVIVLAVRDVPLGFELARIERERVITRLERDAYVLAGSVAQRAATTSGLSADDASTELSFFAATTRTQAVVIDAQGRLFASTDADAPIGESYTNRPEVVSALLGEFASGQRDSTTLGESIVYAAVPVLSGDEVVGVVRLASPESGIEAQVLRKIRGLVLGGLISVLIGVIAALLLANILVRPIDSLRRAAKRLADGEDDVVVAEEGPGELRQLSRTFNEMTRRVRGMLERQRSFAGDAAHQLRTPLTALRLRLESAAESSATNGAESRVHIDAAIDETERLATLTEQMLQLARTEGRVLPVSTFDLSAVVRELAGDWSALAAERDVALSTSVPEQVYVSSSETAWREIAANYLDNAIGHSPRGSRVEMLVTANQHAAELIVRDSGVGMPAADRERAFDRFWRGDNSSARSGSGMGLAIVAHLASAASLNVALRESPGGGIDSVVSCSCVVSP